MSSWITEFCFADDAAIIAPSKDSIVNATVELNKVVRARELNISILKTKFLFVGKNATQCDLDPIHIGDGIIESVTSFHYPRGCSGMPWWCECRFAI